jgi:hypothetical protein
VTRTTFARARMYGAPANGASGSIISPLIDPLANNFAIHQPENRPRPPYLLFPFPTATSRSISRSISRVRNWSITPSAGSLPHTRKSQAWICRRTSRSSPSAPARTLPSTITRPQMASAPGANGNSSGSSNGQNPQHSVHVTTDIGVTVDDDGKLQAYVKKTSQQTTQAGVSAALQSPGFVDHVARATRIGRSQRKI